LADIKKDGYFYINPNIDNHSCIDLNGTDAFWTLEDIPLFWKPYISEFDINIDQDIHALKQARDAAFLSMTKIPMKAHGHVFNYECHPKEWFTKHLLSAKL